MQPLAGIRVVEVASYLSGPLAGMILADLGADVTKVEPPQGDPYRRFGTMYGDSSLFFRATNQNKRSVAIDLKDPDGRAQLHDLLAETDILISNWRPSVAPSLGLTVERVRTDHPRLIWVRVSGYGPDGPLADRPAYDPIIHGRSGAALSGSDRPLGTNNHVADKVAAMMAAQTATAALLARERSGSGAVCDVAMIDAMAYFYGADISAGHRTVDAQPDPTVSAIAAHDVVLRTADSWLTVAPVSGRQIRSALTAVGHAEEWDSVIAAGPGRLQRRFSEILAPQLRTRTTAEWEEVFRTADVPVAPVLDFAEHLADPQVRHNGTYRPVDDPHVGEWLQVRYPAFFDGQRPDRPPRPAPPLP